jgi:hypothetical protein
MPVIYVIKNASFETQGAVTLCGYLVPFRVASLKLKNEQLKLGEEISSKF